MQLSNSNPTCPDLGDLLSEWKNKDSVLFSRPLDGQFVFSIRAFGMDSDLSVIHRWANMDYAKRFWQMEGTIDMLKKSFDTVFASRHVGSFIGCLDSLPVCQLDAYDPRFDNLFGNYDHQVGDMGIHLLITPEKVPIPNFSAKIVMAFATWLFSSGQVMRIVTEPDKDNRASNWLLRRLKFTFLGEISLPEKSANLFVMTRELFEKSPNVYI